MLTLRVALGLYLAVGVTSLFALQGDLRLAVLVLLIGLALKSWNAERAKHPK